MINQDSIETSQHGCFRCTNMINISQTYLENELNPTTITLLQNFISDYRNNQHLLPPMNPEDIKEYIVAGFLTQDEANMLFTEELLAFDPKNPFPSSLNEKVLLGTELARTLLVQAKLMYQKIRFMANTLQGPEYQVIDKDQEIDRLKRRYDSVFHSRETTQTQLWKLERHIQELNSQISSLIATNQGLSEENLSHTRHISKLKMTLAHLKNKETGLLQELDVSRKKYIRDTTNLKLNVVKLNEEIGILTNTRNFISLHRKVQSEDCDSSIPESINSYLSRSNTCSNFKNNKRKTYNSSSIRTLLSERTRSFYNDELTCRSSRTLYNEPLDLTQNSLSLELKDPMSQNDTFIYPNDISSSPTSISPPLNYSSDPELSPELDSALKNYLLNGTIQVPLSILLSSNQKDLHDYCHNIISKLPIKEKYRDTQPLFVKNLEHKSYSQDSDLTVSNSSTLGPDTIFSLKNESTDNLYSAIIDTYFKPRRDSIDSLSSNSSYASALSNLSCESIPKPLIPQKSNRNRLSSRIKIVRKSVSARKIRARTSKFTITPSPNSRPKDNIQDDIKSPKITSNYEICSELPKLELNSMIVEKPKIKKDASDNVSTKKPLQDKIDDICSNNKLSIEEDSSTSSKIKARRDTKKSLETNKILRSSALHSSIDLKITGSSIFSHNNIAQMNIPPKLLSLHQVRLASSTSALGHLKLQENEISKDAIPTEVSVDDAIQRTMMGEFLYKSSKTLLGRQKRHLRFMWLNPQAKTLYWCNVDPGTQRTKFTNQSVIIRSIKLISDPWSPSEMSSLGSSISNSTSHSLYDDKRRWTGQSNQIPMLSILIQSSQREFKIKARNIASHKAWETALLHLQEPQQTLHRDIKPHLTESTSNLPLESLNSISPTSNQEFSLDSISTIDLSQLPNAFPNFNRRKMRIYPSQK